MSLLSEGHLVGLPTETVYLPTALSVHASAVEKLRHAVNGSQPAGFPLLISGQDEAIDFAPAMPRSGAKTGASLLARSGDHCRRRWPRKGSFDSIAGCQPKHDCTRRTDTIPRVGPRNRAGGAEAVAGPACHHRRGRRSRAFATARDVQERFGESVSLIVDDGACRYGGPSTLVSVTDNRWRLVNQGVVSETMLGRLSSETYLFVCTGNTCRSPMAEGYFRKLLAAKLKCSEDELADRGYIVASAGLAAVGGAPASPDAVDILARQGVDLSSHDSQPLTERLLDQADHIFTMTRNHAESILSCRPDFADRIELLAADQSDVFDPIGGGLADYEQCAIEIERHVRAIVSKIQTS